MARILRMPEVAANATEAVLLTWPVSEGGEFSAQDAIATVETEKAVVDIEADAGGVLLKTLVSEGVSVDVGAPIALLGEPGEQRVDDLGSLLAELGVPAVAEARTIPLRRDAPTGAGHASPSVAVPALESSANGNASRSRAFASPLARRLAKQANLRLEQISGTGPGGRIVRRDVELATQRRTVNDEAAPALPGPSPARAPAPALGAGAVAATRAAARAYVDIPHSRIRRAIAARLTESKQSIPHFYLCGTCNVGDLLGLRQKLNAENPVKISVNDLVIKAAAKAQVLVPALNVIWTPDAIRRFETVDVAVAIATDGGLVTPVLRSVERLSISAVAAQVQDFVARARSGKLKQDEIEGGALSVTNLGMFGTQEFAAIINPPQAAILAVGAARQEPVVKNGTLEVGTLMRVTLSVDHRCVDGAQAAEWMKTFVSVIENPLQILT
jgi:pyruvate dehydrogenase E2 component (dihydrolipoamide acetyltransferase)